MNLRNMLKICLVFWKSEPQYAYKLYANKKKHVWPNVQFWLKNCHFLRLSESLPRRRQNFDLPDLDKIVSSISLLGQVEKLA